MKNKNKKSSLLKIKYRESAAKIVIPLLVKDQLVDMEKVSSTLLFEFESQTGEMTYHKDQEAVGDKDLVFTGCALFSNQMALLEES